MIAIPPNKLAYARVAVAAILSSAAMSASQAADSSATQASSNMLDAVTVTARRREESAQQVPIAITALGGAALEDRSVVDMLGLTSVVPNLQVKNTNAGPNQSDIRLRGIPGVSVYVDGIAHSNSAGQLMDVVDVERIEVLQGPQGTLFGKNAIGGAIQYITAKPRDTLGASSKITFGSFGRVDASGTLNIPLSDTFFTKITGASMNRDGYVHNINNGEMEGADRYTVARLDTLWKPSDKFNARVVFYYTGETANQPPFVNLKNNRVCAGDPIPAQYTGRIPGPLCVLNTIGLAVDPTLNFGAQGKWETAASVKGPAGYDYRSYDYSADLSWNINDKLTLRSLTGYRDMWFSKLADHDSTPLVLISNATGGITTELTQELQLAFNNDWLSGTTGAYYYDNKFRRASISWTYSDLTAAQAAQSAALGGRTPSLNQNEFDNFIKGWAVFSEWTAKLGPKFSLTLGGRYTSEDNDTILYPPPVVKAVCCERLPSSLTPAGPQLVATRSATFTNFTPRASVQYQWAADVMTYLTYSEGFNAGGFNTATNVPLPFKPETLSNYELGLKSDLFDRHLRLNVAAFYGVYDDVQVKVNTPFGQTVVLATQNAGKGEVKGLEAQSTWVPTDRLTLNLALGLLHTAYTDTGGTVGLTRNTPFPFSPKTTYNVGGQYRFSVKDADLTLRGDYTYNSRAETNIDPVFTVSQPGYGLLNARLTYQKLDANWNAAIFATNLTNQFYLTNALNITQEGWALGDAGRPRELGITFSMKF